MTRRISAFLGDIHQTLAHFYPATMNNSLVASLATETSDGCEREEVVLYMSRVDSEHHDGRSSNDVSIPRGHRHGMLSSDSTMAARALIHGGSAHHYEFTTPCTHTSTNRRTLPHAGAGAWSARPRLRILSCFSLPRAEAWEGRRRARHLVRHRLFGLLDDKPGSDTSTRSWTHS